MQNTSIYASPNFRRLWLGQTLSQLGDSLTEVAIAVFALKISHNSGITFGTILLLSQLPRICLGWLVGGVVDRWHKRGLMVVCDVARGCLVLSIPWVGTVGWSEFAVVAIAFCGMFYLPAVRAILPETVAREQIGKANAALGQAQSLVAIVGYAAAGGLILTLGPGRTFVADAVSYAVCAGFVLRLKLPAAVWRGTAEVGFGFWQSLKEGWRYHRDKPVVRNLLWISAVAGLAMNGLTVLTAVAVPVLLHQPRGVYGFCMMAMALGMFGGSALIDRVGERWFYAHWINAGFILAGILCVALAFNRNLWLAYGCFFGMGLGNAAFLLPMRTWIVTVTPMAFRGRVYAARGMALAVAGAVSAYGGGVLDQFLGVTPGLAILGTIMLATGVLSSQMPSLKDRPAPISTAL